MAPIRLLRDDVNGAPQPVILIRLGRETIRIKTFNRRVINIVDRQVGVRWIDM